MTSKQLTTRLWATVILAAALLMLGILTLIPLSTAQAYSSQVCSGSVCTIQEVGPFMQNITETCAESGNCTLDDILTVFINVGNYIIGIIGAIVLLMYVIGGVYMMTSGGRSERLAKGKKFLTISTTGLFIVMFAFLGIQVLVSALETGSITDGVSEFACAPGLEGQDCGDNKICTAEGACVSECIYKHSESRTSVNTGAASYSNGQQLSYGYSYQCVDTRSYMNFDTDEDGQFAKAVGADGVSGCETGLCPGGTEVQCCQVYNWQ